MLKNCHYFDCFFYPSLFIDSSFDFFSSFDCITEQILIDEINDYLNDSLYIPDDVQYFFIVHPFDPISGKKCHIHLVFYSPSDISFMYPFLKSLFGFYNCSIAGRFAVLHVLDDFVYLNGINKYLFSDLVKDDSGFYCLRSDLYAK